MCSAHCSFFDLELLAFFSFNLKHLAQARGDEKIGYGRMCIFISFGLVLKLSLSVGCFERLAILSKSRVFANFHQFKSKNNTKWYAISPTMVSEPGYEILVAKSSNHVTPKFKSAGFEVEAIAKKKQSNGTLRTFVHVMHLYRMCS